MIIDWQHHWTPEAVFESMGGVKGQMTPIKRDGKVSVYLHDNFWDLSRHVADMDEAGIDAMAMSWGNGGKSLEEVKFWNNEAAKAAKRYPGRVFPLTPTQPVWGPPALAEVEHAIKDLGFKGVQITSQVLDQVPLDAPELNTFWEKVTELDVPVFVHVSSSAKGFEAARAPWDSNITLVREFDNATAACRVIMGGVLERFPTLKITFSHLGGGIAAIWERVERYATVWGPKFWGWDNETSPLSKPVREYLDMLYFDMAGYEGGMNAVKCALTLIKPERLLFGTDYPANFPNDGQGMRRYIENIRAVAPSKEAADAMLGGNACRLMKIE